MNPISQRLHFENTVLTAYPFSTKSDKCEYGMHLSKHTNPFWESVFRKNRMRGTHASLGTHHDPDGVAAVTSSIPRQLVSMKDYTVRL